MVEVSQVCCRNKTDLFHVVNASAVESPAVSNHLSKIQQRIDFNCDLSKNLVLIRSW